MGRRNRKGVSRRASRRRHVEDVGVTADRRRPERRTFARRAERRTWESKDPNAGPSPPARQYRRGARRSEEHTSELQSLMRTAYAVFCVNTKLHDHAEIDSDRRDGPPG